MGASRRELQAAELNSFGLDRVSVFKNPLDIHTENNPKPYQ